MSLSEEIQRLDDRPAPAQGRVIVITGAMAAGKSTVAELLADRLAKSVHIRGDAFRRMIVNGEAEMTLDPTPEALAQRRMRYRLAGQVADGYAAEGFDAIVQDVIMGPDLSAFVDQIATEERYLIVLSPSVTVLEWREQQRKKQQDVHFSAGAMDNTLRMETEKIGYWLDSSAQSPEETVEDILEHLTQARV